MVWVKTYVEILVSLATGFAAIRLLLLHADCAWVWYTRSRVDNRESAIDVLLQLLILVAVLLVIFQTVLVLVRLLATNDGTFEWLDLLTNKPTNTC